MLELYGKWQVRRGEVNRFVALVHALTDSARTANSSTTRCDWFCHEARSEFISLAAHRDADALVAHVRSCGAQYGALLELAHCDLQWVGVPTAAALAALPLPAKVAAFDSGLGSESAARLYSREAARSPGPHIEIFTRFGIQPGRLALFRRHARACLGRVIAADPGTSRYDWFYSDDGTECLALDTYDNAASMFAHMRNCHAPHAELLKHASMTTEFLGELPAEALEAVRKYDPYVAHFVAVLKPYSSGGFG